MPCLKIGVRGQRSRTSADVCDMELRSRTLHVVFLWDREWESSPGVVACRSVVVGFRFIAAPEGADYLATDEAFNYSNLAWPGTCRLFGISLSTFGFPGIPFTCHVGLLWLL